ncbi:cytochrome b5 [Myxozyma melibiosi]|uniref:Cytochrome b5 n=1 Tax=Myxozyma melibiosi TaxID=54550 RepID=A0ABR1FDD2_9ASCO
MSTGEYISLADVQSHNSKEDLYMVIDGKVYDCTKFIDEHPGGEEVLLDCGGTDATDAFEDVGHSDDARSLLPNMLVGELDPAEAASSSKSKPNTTTASSSGSSSPNFVTIAGFVIMAVAGYIAYLQTVAAKSE